MSRKTVIAPLLSLPTTFSRGSQLDLIKLAWRATLLLYKSRPRLYRVPSLLPRRRVLLFPDKVWQEWESANATHTEAAKQGTGPSTSAGLASARQAITRLEEVVPDIKQFGEWEISEGNADDDDGDIDPHIAGKIQIPTAVLRLPPHELFWEIARAVSRVHMRHRQELLGKFALMASVPSLVLGLILFPNILLPFQSFSTFGVWHNQGIWRVLVQDPTMITCVSWATFVPAVWGSVWLYSCVLMRRSEKRRRIEADATASLWASMIGMDGVEIGLGRLRARKESRADAKSLRELKIREAAIAYNKHTIQQRAAPYQKELQISLQEEKIKKLRKKEAKGASPLSPTKSSAHHQKHKTKESSFPSRPSPPTPSKIGEGRR